MSTSPAPSSQALGRLPLLACGALGVTSLVAASWVRPSGQSIRAPDAEVTQQRALRFEDRPDGSIVVIDATSKRVFDTVSGQAGFVRGTLRGLARERKRAGLGPEQPFLLMGRADGRLTLHDPATGRLIDLDAFGPLNASAFARLLEDSPLPAAPVASHTPRSP